MSFAGLEDAAATLDALAAGATPDRTRAIVGALALDALTWSTTSRDILDAAAAATRPCRPSRMRGGAMKGIKTMATSSCNE